MVQLCIEIPVEEGGCPQWTIVELQGDIETKSEAASLSGKFIGDLHFTHKNQPILIIGHHILQGKLQTLEKPFLVMTRNRSEMEKLGDEETMETDETKDNSSTDSHYFVKAIVRNKLIFKVRPKPIIAHVPKKL